MGRIFLGASKQVTRTRERGEAAALPVLVIGDVRLAAAFQSDSVRTRFRRNGHATSAKPLRMRRVTAGISMTERESNVSASAGVLVTPPTGGVVRASSARAPTFWFALGARVLMGVLVMSCARERASRMPSTRRPEPARSAADGEILGADNQSPTDALQTNLTSEHAAPGWRIEDGTFVRSTELQDPGVHEEASPTAREHTEGRDCIADERRRAASGTDAGLSTRADETMPGPRALERSLTGGCPQPSEH